MLNSQLSLLSLLFTSIFYPPLGKWGGHNLYLSPEPNAENDLLQLHCNISYGYYNIIVIV